MNNDPFVAILAAGEASRFGGKKLDATLCGRPLGRHALEIALALGAGTPAIVTGDPIPQFAVDAAKAGEAVLIANPDARRGLGTSVALAALHAERAGRACLLLMLADMPLVTVGSLIRLLEKASPGHPSAASYPGRIAGIPACFTRDFYPQLQQLDGERGAGKLLRQAPGTVLIELRSGELSDIDTPDDLRAIEAALGARPLRKGPLS